MTPSDGSRDGTTSSNDAAECAYTDALLIWMGICGQTVVA